MEKNARFTFDIETGPSDNIAEFIKPYPTFDPSTIKTGNMKDEALIAEKIASAETKHNDGRSFYYDNETKKLLIKSFASRVEAIGINITDLNGKTENYVLTGEEPDILKTFWGMLSQFNTMYLDKVVCGWNIHEFDLPFLIHRSWRYRVKIPWNHFSSRQSYRGGRLYFNENICDLMKIYSAGSFQNKFTSLHNASLCVLGKGKNDGISGDMFWQKMRSNNVSDREDAERYLKLDLELVDELAFVLLG
jgi:DNA polymerase elongation subunit (family B)